MILDIRLRYTFPIVSQRMLASLLDDKMMECLPGLGIKIISDMFHRVGKYESLKISFIIWVT